MIKMEMCCLGWWVWRYVEVVGCCIYCGGDNMDRFWDGEDLYRMVVVNLLVVCGVLIFWGWNYVWLYIVLYCFIVDC